MGLKTITPPVAEPLTIAEAQNRLALDGDEGYIRVTLSSLIRQAREYAEGYQNRRYMLQTLELVLDTVGSEVQFINCSPVQSIESFVVIDAGGTEHTVPPDSYFLDDSGLVNKLILRETLLIQPQQRSAYHIRFVAGYGNAEDVPETVKQAMIIHMKLLYDDYDPPRRTALERSRDALLSFDRVVPI